MVKLRELIDDAIQASKRSDLGITLYFDKTEQKICYLERDGTKVCSASMKDLTDDQQITIASSSGGQTISLSGDNPSSVFVPIPDNIDDQQLSVTPYAGGQTVSLSGDNPSSVNIPIPNPIPNTDDQQLTVDFIATGVNVNLSGDNPSSIFVPFSPDNQQLSVSPYAGGQTVSLTGDNPSSVNIPIPPATVNTDVWQMTGVAFVDPVNGDNGTAVVGDGNLPYLTVTAAQAAATNIYLTPGTYTETIILQTETTYYCPFGVVFTNGGIRCTTQIVNTKWLGHADFIGDFFQLYLIEGEYINFTFEFNRMQTTGQSSFTILIAADVAGTSNIDIKGVSIADFGSNAHGPRFWGTLSGTLTVSEFIRSPYGTIVFGSNPGVPLSGNFIVNCPSITLMNGGWAGNNGAFKQAIYFISNGPDTDVTINGDLHTTMIANVGGGLLSSLNTNGNGGIYKHNGNVYGGIMHAIVLNKDINVIVKGDVQSLGAAFIVSTTAVLTINGSTIEHGASCSITNTCRVFISDSEINCTANVNGITHSAAAAELYLKNVTFETAGTIFVFSVIAPITGMVNVASQVINSATVANLYTALQAVGSGFTVEPTIVVNKNI